MQLHSVLLLSAAGVATGFHAIAPLRAPSRCTGICAYETPITSSPAPPIAPTVPTPTASTAAKDVTDAMSITPPVDREQMLQQAAAAVLRARGAGENRFIMRLFLPRGEGLSPPDESWQGGIMQLYAVASPLVRDLLRRLSTDVAGVPPSLREQRIDASGVDGESIWMAESAKPEDDGVAFVQPMTESLQTIRKISTDAGKRPMLLVNPQWKERDDPLDALSRKSGFLGALGNALGGKAAMEGELSAMGFIATYTLSEYVCRGSRICLLLSYPYAWSAFYRNAETDGWEPLLSGEEDRPTYQQIEAALIDQDVPFRFTEFDVNNIV